MAVRVKVCGIRSDDDLRAALEAGADAVGFLVGLDYATDDVLEPSDAAMLASSVPPFVTRVLVTHRTTPDEVSALVREVPCDAVQLHGDFPLGEVGALREALPPGARVYRVVHVTGPESVPFAAEAARVADAIHLDTRTPHLLGGTGLAHDWKLSMRIVRWVPCPVILAGGLAPGNVADAIRTVHPWAVDANSGLETPDGDKDGAKVREFVRAARGA